ncbi:hypothetical protein MEI_01512, partial [Bartonella vinsonii subsp. arupensis Pm136co]
LQSDDSAVVHYDKTDDENGTINYTSVTFGKGKDSKPVALHNVANGNIAEGSHDVVTGGQINTISQDIAKFLGGSAAFKEGVFIEPTYKLSKVSTEGKVEDSEFNDVGSAELDIRMGSGLIPLSRSIRSRTMAVQLSPLTIVLLKL